MFSYSKVYELQMLNTDGIILSCCFSCKGGSNKMKVQVTLLSVVIGVGHIRWGQVNLLCLILGSIK